MPRAPFKILYVGRNRSVRRRLIDLLGQAGYAVKVEMNPLQSIHGTAGKFEFVVYDDEGADGSPRGKPPKGSKIAHRRRRAVLTAHMKRTAAAPRGTNRQDSKEVVMTLRSLREIMGTTQREMVVKTLMTQSQLSRVETRRDHLISTLRTYVEALGGQVRVVAVIDGIDVALENV